MADIRKRVSEILSFEDRSRAGRATANVLRVLVVSRGTSWRSELIQDLALLDEFRGAKAIDKGEVDESLRKLEKKGLVRVEERIRGTVGPGRGVRDKLISLVDFLETQNALSRDRVLTAYMHERMVRAP